MNYLSTTSTFKCSSFLPFFEVSSARTSLRFLTFLSAQQQQKQTFLLHRKRRKYANEMFSLRKSTFQHLIMLCCVNNTSWGCQRDDNLCSCKTLQLTDGFVIHRRIWSGARYDVGEYRPLKQPGADIFILSVWYMLMQPPDAKSSSSFSALVALSNGVGE